MGARWGADRAVLAPIRCRARSARAPLAHCSRAARGRGIAEEHAGLPPVPDFDALAQEVGPRLRAFVWALRLSHASLRLSQEALGVLRGLAEEESLLAAQARGIHWEV